MDSSLPVELILLGIRQAVWNASNLAVAVVIYQ
jgi:hypothetical protein